MHLLTPPVIYFKEVAGSGSITEAAEALHVSPSAISRQIGRLEAAIGVPLFIRHPRGMLLTEAGRLLLAHARRSETESGALLEELRASTAGRTRLIKVASAEGLASSRVAVAMAKISAAHQDVVFKLAVTSSSDATRQVIDGRADVGAAFTLGPQKDVAVEFSRPAPLYAAMVTSHPLAARSSITLEELCEHKLTLAGAGITQRELFDIALQREGLAAEIALETDQVASALEFARNGAGIALASRLAVPADALTGLVFVAVDHSVLNQREAQIHTMSRRRKSAIISAFLVTLSEVLTSD
ncbi:LysR family transcriptional regulator [Arthrobacter sp. NPDC090010]|uniref:LysR family transcriptional regulator n=1 Tax=Arthrobacter sp. NPDC090010 TaxID=3363942 RepID=UPI00380F4D22